MKSIGSKILSILAVFLVFILLSNLFNIQSLNKVSESNHEVSEKYLIKVTELGEIARDYQAVQKHLNSHLITYMEQEKTAIEVQINDSKNSLVENVNQYGAYVDDDDREIFNKLMEDLKSYFQTFEMVVERSRTGDNYGAFHMTNTELGALTTEIEGLIGELIDTNYAAVNKAKEAQATTVNSSYVVIAVSIVALIVLTVLAMLFVTAKVTKPLKNATKSLNTMISDIESGEGDLTVRLKGKSKDEVGQLVSGINSLIESLQHIMLEVRTYSEELKVNVDSVFRQVGSVNESVNDTSASMEELSASMEETTATTLSLSEQANGINQEMQDMNKEAQQGSDYAKNIKNNADRMKDDAIGSKNKALQMMEEIKENLAQAIQNSTKVELINELTNEILSISEQTTLLSLNASIEAARAGEAGRGFAVVADEIRSLADSSNDTANKIQEISVMVTSAVNDLNSNANNMIEFVNMDVMKDYDMMVDTVDQYNKDANSFDEILSKFYNNTDRLSQTMTDMAGAINQITVTMEESSRAIDNVVNNSNELVGSMGTISGDMEKNSEISNTLQQQVQTFKNL